MKLICSLLFVALCIQPVKGDFSSGSNTFASAGVIPTATTQDESSVTTLDSFTAEPGEPDFTGVKRTAWWRWTAPVNGWATFSTEDNPFPSNALEDTHLAVFTGSAVNSLSLVVRNNNAINTRLSRATFYAVAGTTYSIQVDSAYSGYMGQVELNLRFMPSSPLRILCSSIDSTTAPVQLNLSATALGAVTAKLVLDGKAYSLKGTATVDGWFSAQVVRPPLPSGQPVAPLRVIVDLVTNDRRFHNWWLQNGSGSAEPLSAWRVTPFTSAAPHPLAPRFTGVFDMSNTGDGYLTATIGVSGAVAISGRTGDGKAFTSSSALCLPQSGSPTEYPSPLGSSAARLTGTVLFVDVMAGTDLLDSSVMNYRRSPATTGVFYPSGLSESFVIFGAAYQAPSAGQRAMALLNASGGNGKLGLNSTPGEFNGTLVNTVFSTANAFTFSGSSFKNTLTVNRLTGVVSGTSSVTPGYTRTLRGVITLDAGIPVVRGYVTGKTRTGSFKVMP